MMIGNHSSQVALLRTVPCWFKAAQEAWIEPFMAGAAEGIRGSFAPVRFGIPKVARRAVPT